MIKVPTAATGGSWRSGGAVRNGMVCTVCTGFGVQYVQYVHIVQYPQSVQYLRHVQHVLYNMTLNYWFELNMYSTYNK